MWNEIVEPKDDGLRATADIIRQNVDVGIDTYANANNHYEGCAPVKSFNATTRNLGEYTRVQLESDVSNRRSRKAIANARVKTLHKVIDRINRMV